ncbi:MAG: HAD family phosphatase [Firmicutes bacterium]|nr:HAD family phosphatase [Bacillota bacterium]
MKYGLVALDIDGTLLDSNGELSARVRRTIKAVIDRGVMVTLATGRRISSTLPWAKALGIEIPLVVHNGAVIVCPKTEKIQLQKGIPVTIAQQIHTDLLKRKVPHLVYKGEDHGDTGYLPTEFNSRSRALFLEYIDDHIQNVEQVYFSEPVIKISALGETKQIMAYLEQWQADYGQDTSLTIYNSVDYSGVDFIPPTCSKATGIKHVAEQLGLSIEQVVAIGDQANDLEMIKAAGLGIAMYNAPQEVKEVAKYVTSSNDQDGVAQALEDIFL